MLEIKLEKSNGEAVAARSHMCLVLPIPPRPAWDAPLLVPD